MVFRYFCDHILTRGVSAHREQIRSLDPETSERQLLAVDSRDGSLSTVDSDKHLVLTTR